MTKHFLVPALALAASLSLATFAQADDFKRIKSEADFNSLVAGKTVTWDRGSGKVHKDGRTTGKLKGAGKYYGNWKFANGFYCSNIVINNEARGTNCQVAEISGNKLRLTRDKGKGQQTVFMLK